MRRNIKFRLREIGFSNEDLGIVGFVKLNSSFGSNLEVIHTKGIEDPYDKFQIEDLILTSILPEPYGLGKLIWEQLIYDKNGIEVYEGDKVIIKDLFGKVIVRNTIFINGCWIFRDEKQQVTDADITDEVIEVIRK